MRILLACQQSSHTYPLPAYGFWRTYLVAGLREAGHDVMEVPEADWARGLLPLSHEERTCWRDEIWSRTLAAARSTPAVDLFLGYLYPRQIEPGAVRELRATGVPAVNFFCDNVREFRRLPDEFAPFDLHWVPEHAALALYAARGWPALFAPMPCWVPPERRRLSDREEPVVSFIGRHDPLRGTVLAAVIRNGLPLVVYGDSWSEQAAASSGAPRPGWRARFDDWRDFYRRQGARLTWRRLTRGRRMSPGTARFDFGPWQRLPLSEEAYLETLATSAVTLGINRYPTFESAESLPTYSRLRDIEAPMLGACHLTEWAPELPLLYELGAEIEAYRDDAELIAKAHALLADAPRRRALRLGGQRRALAHHTVGRSLERIAHALGLAPRPSFP